MTGLLLHEQMGRKAWIFSGLYGVDGVNKKMPTEFIFDYSSCGHCIWPRRADDKWLGLGSKLFCRLPPAHVAFWIIFTVSSSLITLCCRFRPCLSAC